MSLPVVRSPLGLPLGDRGLLPLPDALPGVGAGVVAGGPYTVPKGCWIPIPGRPTGRGQGLFLRALPSGCVVWCGVVWCGVVWCGVVWCGVPKALLPKGKGRDVYPRVQVNGLGCVCCVRAVCKCVVA